MHAMCVTRVASHVLIPMVVPEPAAYGNAWQVICSSWWSQVTVALNAMHPAPQGCNNACMCCWYLCLFSTGRNDLPCLCGPQPLGPDCWLFMHAVMHEGNSSHEGENPRAHSNPMRQAIYMFHLQHQQSSQGIHAPRTMAQAPSWQPQKPVLVKTMPVIDTSGACHLPVVLNVLIVGSHAHPARE